MKKIKKWIDDLVKKHYQKRQKKLNDYYKHCAYDKKYTYRKMVEINYNSSQLMFGLFVVILILFVSLLVAIAI